MSLVIRCRPNGPFVIEGPVTVVDHEGKPFTIDPSKANVALCRCGHSQRKPFCDGAHKTCGFAAAETAAPVQESQ